MEQVKVVIPIYKSTLSEQEHASLQQTVRVLGHHPLVMLCPLGLDVSSITQEFPMLQLVAVSDAWLGRRNGIAGYNQMMLSSAFYDLFADAEYILICHTDAWIFRDELSDWCARGYDCVAAPWVRRAIYNVPIVQHWLALRCRWAAAHKQFVRQMLYGRIGNGGLSLRRVASFRAACERYKEVVVKYKDAPHHFYNEDVFWAVVPLEFSYPTWREALSFAFDTNPKYCFKLCQQRLPFGCHSWSKPRMWRFWQRFISW
ncbi:MAG: DUF5672 family protein [Alistipes sp.]